MAVSHERLRTLVAETLRDSATVRALRSDEFLAGTLLTPRFEIERRLGAGGSGIVYRAFDRQSQLPVALKVLHLRDPDAIYWLKDEFRALADLEHPNIIQLHQLVHYGEHWFFTMELVDGVPFDAYVAPARRVDHQRLRAALAQLVDGVEAMHMAGKLHRDVKPSNVLVRSDGQLIVLDFGLVQDLSLLDEREPTTVLRDRVALICGTPEYMAPEQASGLFATPASDWYAVGVMLFEALTGALPYTGNPLQVMLEKQLRDPQSPAALASNVPDELAALCVELLARDPSRRPGPDAIRASLGVAASARARRTTLRSSAPAALVGRSQELQSLHDAYDASSHGAVCLLVHGPSGIGKSALLRHFLDELAGARDVLVASSRCFERESVPYKALDGVVDRIAEHLPELIGPALRNLPVPNVAALLRVFPVLARCTDLNEHAEPEPRELDVQETRRRAFAAFRQLASLFAERLRLVVCIDDMQWGDTESAHLLLELLRGPAAPRVLVIGSYRSEEATSSPLLSVLLPALGNGTTGAAVRELALRPLEQGDALGLASRMIHAAGATSSEHAQRIARESAGSPFFIEALVQYHQTRGWRAEDGPVSLDELVLACVAELPDQARSLLQVVVVAGQPLEQRVALHAARLTGTSRALSILRTARLIRTRGQTDEPAIEPYHDRIREAVHHALDPEHAVELHAAVADALEDCGQAEPALLAWEHFRAQRPERALPYALQAASAARGALAFGHAAGLYALALECTGDGDPRAAEIRQVYADALANAGRAAEAGVQFARLAAQGPAAAARSASARAAQQYLAAGHIDEGLMLLKPLMSSAGVTYPETPQHVLQVLLEGWQALVTRGTQVAQRPSADAPSAELMRIDVGRLATDELSHCDPIRAAAIMMQVVQPALDLGEPGRAAWALSRYALFTASAGAADTIDEAEDMFTRAEQLAATSGDAVLLGSIYVNRSRLSLSAHRWREGLERAELAARYMAEQCVGGWRYVAVANNVVLYSLFALGRLPELAGRTFAQQQRASELGDTYVHLTTYFYAAMCRLAGDDPEGAAALLTAAARMRKHTSFLFQDWLNLQGGVACDIYRGELEQAWQRLERGWPELEQAHLLNLAVVREIALRLRGNLAVGMAMRQRDEPRFLADAAQCAQLLDAHGCALARAAAQSVRAGIAWCEGRGDVALARLEHARSAYEEADMPLDVATCSELGGRLAGAGVVAAAVWSEFGIAAKQRWLTLCFPWSDRNV